MGLGRAEDLHVARSHDQEEHATVHVLRSCWSVVVEWSAFYLFKTISYVSIKIKHGMKSSKIRYRLKFIKVKYYRNNYKN